MNPGRLVLVGFAMILVGFLVAAIGTFTSPGAAGGGGFILIGPIPIIFGSGPNSGMLATVALVITAAMVFVYLLTFLLTWRSGRHPRRGEEAEIGTKSE